MERYLSKTSLVIVDSCNYIKGFRYELYCVARALETRSCVVWVDGDEKICESWDSERSYSDGLLNEIRFRFEEPRGKDRWDRPLFYVDMTEGVEAAAAITATTTTTATTTATTTSTTTATKTCTSFTPTQSSNTLILTDSRNSTDRHKNIPQSLWDEDTKTIAPSVLREESEEVDDDDQTVQTVSTTLSAACGLRRTGKTNVVRNTTSFRAVNTVKEDEDGSVMMEKIDLNTMHPPAPPPPPPQQQQQQQQQQHGATEKENAQKTNNLSILSSSNPPAQAIISHLLGTRSLKESTATRVEEPAESDVLHNVDAIALGVCNELVKLQKNCWGVGGGCVKLQVEGASGMVVFAREVRIQELRRLQRQFVKGVARNGIGGGGKGGGNKTSIIDMFLQYLVIAIS